MIPGPGESLTSPSVVQRLLQSHGLRIRKQLGQHFLSDANVLRGMVEAARLPPEGATLEIGPGLGVLTRELSSRSTLVVAIEYDRKLLPVLLETALPAGNVRVVMGDAVRLLESQPTPALFAGGDPPEGVEWYGPERSELPASSRGPEITCVSNLPYGITSPALVALLSQKEHFRSLVLMIQAEVADRLIARPGTAGYGALTVFASYHARVERVLPVSRRCFFPPPEVDSAVVRLTPVPGGTVPVKDPERFFQVSRALFGQRRKTSANALLKLPDHPTRDQVASALESAGIPANTRGEDLSLEQMAAIADALVGKPC